MLLLGATPILAADDPMLARVLSIETDRVTLSVQNGMNGDAAPLSIAVSKADLPPGLAPGDLVRLWPGSNSGAGARLSPLDRDMTGMDRTGVRARLMRGAERGFGGGRNGR